MRALDAGAESLPGPIAAILPPDPVSPDHHYVIEVRRSRGYDAGLRSAALPANPPPGIVVHGYSRTIKQFFFAGVLPFSNVLGDQDLHVFSGPPGSDFTLRLLEAGPDDLWARVRVGGPNYWRNFGVDVTIDRKLGNPEYTSWRQVNVRPCFFALTAPHSYRYRTAQQTYTVDALSFGYEVPSYVWTVGGVVLNAPRGSVTLDVDTSVPDPLEGWQSRTQRLTFDYTLTGAHLALAGPPGDPVAHGNFAVGLEVTVNEFSPEVLKSSYPERAVTTTLRYDTVEIEWDDSYQQQQDHCQKVIEVPGSMLSAPTIFRRRRARLCRGGPENDSRYSSPRWRLLAELIWRRSGVRRRRSNWPSCPITCSARHVGGEVGLLKPLVHEGRAPTPHQPARPTSRHQLPSRRSHTWEH